MDEVLNQAPADISLDVVKEIFEKHNQKALPALMELWDIQEKQKVHNVSEHQNKWKQIRETCDDFDREMQNMLAQAMQRR